MKKITFNSLLKSSSSRTDSRMSLMHVILKSIVKAYKLQCIIITHVEVKTIMINKPSASDIHHLQLDHFNNDGL